MLRIMSSFLKLWGYLRVPAINVKIFDLLLQGSLLVVILLEHNAFLLLRRDSDSYMVSMLIEDWAVVGVGCLQFLVGGLLGWWGKARRKLAISLGLAIAGILGLIVLAFPFDRENNPLIELCGRTPIPELSRADVLRMDASTKATLRAVFLIATIAGCSLAKISIWAHGFTFLDDYNPRNGPFIYGMLVTIQLSLGLSGRDWLRTSANLSHWRTPQLSISLLILLFSLLYALLPDVVKDDEEQNGDDGFWASFKRIMGNRRIAQQMAGVSLLSAALYNFFNYDRQYAQARYQVDVSWPDARIPLLTTSIFRPIVIIFFIMIFRIRFSVGCREGLSPVKASRVGAALAAGVATLFAVVASMDCSSTDVFGMDGSTYSPPSCSAACRCDSESHGFTPVCGLSTSRTFFSPCEAGCRAYDNFNEFLVFRNCSCDPVGVTRGACSLQSCQVTYSLYQIFVTLILAVTGTSLLMQGMSLLRAARRADRPLTIALTLAATAFASDLIGHLIYFAINNKTCAFFNAGRCQFHNSSLNAIAILSAILAALSTVCCFTASRSKGNPHELLQTENT